MMKKALSCAAAIACCAAVWGTAPRAIVVTAAAQTQGQLYDWLTDGGDNQRTGWNRNEKVLTKDNVKTVKLLWKLETRNQIRALHSLMPVLVVGQMTTPSGVKQVGYLAGISDYLFNDTTTT